MKESILNRSLLLLVLALVPWVAPAQPAPNPPGQLSYQGYLTDAGGTPLATNTPQNYTVNFRIYSASTNGTPVWGEQQVVNVDRGYFTVLLGNGSSIPGAPFASDLTGVFAGTNASDRYIGMTVTELSPNEIAPRLQLLASPYALLARNAGALVSPDGSNLVTAANGQLIVNGTIAGNGAGLTALNAGSLTGTLLPAQVPASVVTNRASGVTLTGALSGDGAGLTNIPASAVAPSPPGMVLIPAGPFTMGNTNKDADITDASPTNVFVSAFYMDANLVSWSQWQSVYYWAANHGYNFVNAGVGKAANHPVTAVDWYDCVKWCNARSEQTGRTPVYYADGSRTNVYRSGQIDVTNGCLNWAANGYRLPTEAEWEKAARGGLSGQRFPWGNVISENLANYYGNTTTYSYDLGPNGYNSIGLIGGSPYTSPVGYFAPNGYGLYDMNGNLTEWCWDWYGTPYTAGSDPRGPASGYGRVMRGSSYYDRAYVARCAFRSSDAPTDNYDGLVGFRCVRGL